MPHDGLTKDFAMSYRAPLTWGLILCVAMTTAALSTSMLAAANEGADGQSGERVVWGTIVTATDDSLTVQPKPPTRRVSRRGARRGAATAATTRPAAPKLEPPPAEQVIAIAKDQTEVAFAQVHRELPMADGTTLRAFIDPVPGTVGDLKPGLSVQVKVRDGVAAQVLIAWGERGTIVGVGPDSITYRPEPPPDGAKEDAPNERTVTVSPDTRARFEIIVAEGPTGGGGFSRTYEYKPAKLADLKAGDAVIVCAKDGAAAKVTVLSAE